jgi:DNA mismatch repair protein MutS
MADGPCDCAAAKALRRGQERCMSLNRAAPIAKAGSAQPGDRARPGSVISLLWEQAPELPASAGSQDPAVLTDLNLDQVIAAVAGEREERELISRLLAEPVRDVGIIQYRHEVFSDLEDPAVLQALAGFTKRLHQVRGHLNQLTDMRYAQQRDGWFLDAAATYCDAVSSLADDLGTTGIRSRGLTAFREYLTRYVSSSGFGQLAADTAARKDELAGITYQIRIRGLRVDVSRYEGEPDYSDEIQNTFERFRQGAVKDYRIQFRTWPGMNHVAAQIAELVARLYRDEFTALERFCREHARFIDPVIREVDREMQFYLAYLDYISPLRAAGLEFCYPELAVGSKDIFGTDTFDLALAARLTGGGGKPVVTNDFQLTGPERVIVVSGPNQGGKTTFARTFGQLHHLTSTGCPVPGSAARLSLYDHLFTHFEREEDLGNLTGKLEDDLLRIQKALLAATADSIVIMNEIFTSTTVADARFLGEKVLAKVTDLDLLCVYVTFIDELASLGPSVVSMASTIVPDNSAERTYKVIRKPADGLAYALAIARKHGVSYEQLAERLGR